MRWLFVLLVACGSRDSSVIVRDIPAVVADASIDALAIDAARRQVDVPDDYDATVLGKPFRGARMLCLASAGMALVSLALEDGRDVTRELESLVGKALEPATQQPFDTGAVRVGDRELPASVLYRGLLGVMLVGFDRIGATTRFDFVDALAESLARDLAHEFVATYRAGGRDGIWPCDHAPAASFLRLHGRLRDNAASARTADTLVTRLRALLDGGFPTRVDRRGKIVDGTLRSTALAFTAGHLLAGEPALARTFAEKLIESCERDRLTGRAACREWTGKQRRPDAASGPIFGDMSAGATALAIVATRALPDLAWNAALLGTADFFGRAQLGGFERALLALGETARAW